MRFVAVQLFFDWVLLLPQSTFAQLGSLLGARSCELLVLWGGAWAGQMLRG